MREKESNDYSELLTKLETWEDMLASSGPRAVDGIQMEMHEYLDKKVDEDFDILRKEHQANACIDFNHQKNYD
jgi:hypothetical protein